MKDKEKILKATAKVLFALLFAMVVIAITSLETGIMIVGGILLIYLIKKYISKIASALLFLLLLIVTGIILFIIGFVLLYALEVVGGCYFYGWGPLDLIERFSVNPAEALGSAVAYALFPLVLYFGLMIWWEGAK